MVASCAITAMAASGTGEVDTGDAKYPYRWSISCGSTNGTAYIGTTEAPTTVTAYAYNLLYSAENKIYGYSDTDDNTGYSSVTVTPNNILRIDGYNIPSTIKETHASFYVAGIYAANSYAVA